MDKKEPDPPKASADSVSASASASASCKDVTETNSKTLRDDIEEDDFSKSRDGYDGADGDGSKSPYRQPPLPCELTAEWTVKAQLKFSRGGETIHQKFNSHKSAVSPVRVIYKWSAANQTPPSSTTTNIKDEKDENYHHKADSSNPSQTQNPSKTEETFHPQGESFRSTAYSKAFDGAGAGGGGGGGKAFGSDDFYGTRCRSTCNIVVSAVADFLPNPAAKDFDTTDTLKRKQFHKFQTEPDFISEEEPDPFVFNTSAMYDILPITTATAATTTEQSVTKLLDLRDAVCQTSDTETKFLEELAAYRQAANLSYSKELHDSRHYKTGKTSNASEYLLDENLPFLPSSIFSTPKTLKSASLPRMPFPSGSPQNFPYTPATPSLATRKSSGIGKIDPSKKPRTVHIDVYCTGSEEDNQADEEESSTSSSSRTDDRLKGSQRFNDNTSSGTFQTVLENEQMLLKHQRITDKQVLPRRLALQQKSEKLEKSQRPQRPQSFKLPSTITKSDQPVDMPGGHSITQSNTAEEIHESKQMLFRKHIGDQRAIKLQNLRQKYIRQHSDDAVSLGYPNSSHSTIRDPTCSSISSTMATDVLVAHEDVKENEDDDRKDLLVDGSNLIAGKLEAFEYEDSDNRLGISGMEGLWDKKSNLGDTIQKRPVSGSSPISHHHLPVIEESVYNVQSRQQVSPSDLKNYSDTVDFANSPVGFYAHYHRPGFLQFFGLPADTQQPHSAPLERSLSPSFPHPEYQRTLQRWKSEAYENLYTKEEGQEQISSISPTEMMRQHKTMAATLTAADPNTVRSRRFDMQTSGYKDSKPDEESMQSSVVITGYSSDYLDIARRFGEVVAIRKPGHHVGPTKNPNCSCDNCLRWQAERFKSHNRTYSLDEHPSLYK